LLVAQGASAQLPTVPGPKPGTVTFEDNWSQKERDFFWRKTTVDAEGYLRIAGTEDQVNVINEARSHYSFPKQIETGLESLVSRVEKAGFPFVGTWKEDKYRTTMLFGNRTSGFLMYTLFNFAKMGASFEVVRGFARFQIKGSPAVVTLTVPPRGTKGLWKVTTYRSGVQHEIHLNEELLSPEKKPKKNLAQILGLANSIID
jgi:hypothetical protein